MFLKLALIEFLENIKKKKTITLFTNLGHLWEENTELMNYSYKL